MNEAAHPDQTSPSARTKLLIAELESRHQAWRKEVEELTRLHAEAADTARREADDILARARDEVCRILVDARRQIREVSGNMQTVQHLRAEIGRISHAVRPDQREGPGDEEETPSDSVLRARRELRRMMAEAAPDLDALAAEAVQFSSAQESSTALTHE